MDVLTEIEINAPRDRVASYAADPDRATEWYKNIKSVEWRSSRPLAVGSRLAFVAQFLGRTLAYEYEIVEFEPSRRLVMRTAHGPFPMETTYEWQDLPERRTRMRLRNRGMPSGFSKFLVPFISRAVRRNNRQDLARLKARLEG